jgi:acyl carrier protein
MSGMGSQNPVPAAEDEDMAADPPLAIVLASVMIGLFIWTIISLRKHRRATLAAAECWRDRPTMGDGEFLMRCEIPDEPLPVKVALAARRVIAALGTVPPETIRPDDTFAKDLVQLPFWDSLEWVGLVMGVEEEFAEKVLVAESCIDDAVKLAGGRHTELRVKHVVRAMALSATYRPKEALLDDEL